MSIRVEDGSPAGRVLSLITDLLEAKRISRAESEVVHELLFHPEFPASLRQHPRMTKARAMELLGPFVHRPG